MPEMQQDGPISFSHDSSPSTKPVSQALDKGKWNLYNENDNENRFQ